MRTTIDRAGRVVVPKALRDRLGLEAGTAVEVTDRGGELVLRPVGTKVRLAQRGTRTVFVADGPEGTDTTLTDDDVRDLVDESRQWPRS